jgi:hypothetical protein
MNLKAAYLCIDRDSVWEPQGPIISCPRCTSSICVPLAAWVPTQTMTDKVCVKVAQPEPPKRGNRRFMRAMREPRGV